MPLGGYQGCRFEIYFATPGQKEEAKAIAKSKGITLTQYILRLIEADQAREKRPPRPNREHELQAKIATLEQDLRLTKMALDKAKLHISLTTPPPGVVHKLDSRMVTILEGQKTVNEEGLLRMLNIQEGEKELIKLVRRELEDLEGFGLIRKTSKGWRWVK
jgi:hypothetical protein